MCVVPVINVSDCCVIREERGREHLYGETGPSHAIRHVLKHFPARLFVYKWQPNAWFGRVTCKQATAERCCSRVTCTQATAEHLSNLGYLYTSNSWKLVVVGDLYTSNWWTFAVAGWLVHKQQMNVCCGRVTCSQATAEHFLWPVYLRTCRQIPDEHFLWPGYWSTCRQVTAEHFLWQGYLYTSNS